MVNEKNQTRRRNHHHVNDERVIMESVLDDVKLLRNEKESLRHDVNNLKDDIKILRGEFKALRKSAEEDPSVIDVVITVEDVLADFPSENAIRSAESTAPEGEGTISAKKKRRKNKKNKGNNNNLTNSLSTAAAAASGILGNVSVVGASNTKMAAGFIFIALLVSIAFGQQGILSRTSNNPLLREQESGQSGTHSNMAHSTIALGDNEVKTSHVGVSLPTNQDRLTVIEEALPRREQKSGQTDNPQRVEQAVASPKLRYVGDPSVEDLTDLVLPAAQHHLRIVGKTSRNLRALGKIDRSATSKRRNDVGVARNHGLQILARDNEGGGTTTLNNNANDVRHHPDDGRVEGDEDSNTRNLEVELLFSSSHATISSPSPSSISFFPLEKKNDDDVRSAPTTNPALPIVASNRPSLAPEITDDASDAQSASQTGYELTALSKGVDFYPGYVCDANPETCGCPNSLQTDYRGTISKTALGYPCEKWDAPLIKVVWGKDYPKEFPNAGLDDNYCRNPGDDRGAYCFVAGGQGYGYCDVPVCGSVTESPTSTSIPTSSTVPTGSPSSSIIPSSSSSPTRVCPVADREVCGCNVVRQSDYRGTINATNDGFDCIRWDSELAKELNYKIDFVRDFPGIGLEDNYCRNPGNLDSGPFCMTPFHTIEGAYIRSCDVPKCEPCACSPLCGRSNDAACACPSVFQADECCEKDDADCKCPYLKEACSKILEVEGKSKEFCEDASVACCGGNTEGDNICKCAMHEQICMDFPSQSTCDYAAEVCCETDQCYCDFYTYSTTFSVTQSDDKAGKCSEAEDRQFVSVTAEKLILREIYHILAGEYWIDSISWLNDTVPHCDWFGIECDQEGHVIEIILRDNNLEGELQNDYPAILPGLTKFDLAGNKISAKVDTNALLYNRQLVHLDLSRNSFSGHLDMTFPPSTSYVNISHNNLTSAGFKRFNPAYERLRVIDLSNNRIDQDASTFFFDIPRNLEKLVLSNNILKGALPNPFPLPNMGIFKIDNNAISGALPDFPAPRLKMLDVSNQKKGEYDGGLSGPIPTTLSNLIDLTVLNLAGNKFTQEIPPDLGNLHFLRVLNISSNALDKSIPSELETLKDFLEVLDLSSNRLSGSIPLELAKLQDTLVHFNLRGNSNFLGPAPLDLCFLPGFDLLNNASFCPPERNALREIYDSTKGIEWTESKLWLHPVISHCDWYGVTCKENNTNTIKLELRNNGLSGKLGEEIALLTHLEVLDLSDNDIKGSIPTEIRKLSHLKYVRLCYNGFIGNETNFGNLQDLELIQIHGNRLSGTIPRLNLTFSNKSSFVSDCGNPSDFEQPLICDECKMCCNAQGDCYSTELHPIQNSEFKTFLYFSCAFIGMLFAASGVLASAMYARNRFQNRGMPESSIRCPSYKGKDRKYALSTIGNDSVYQFFLRNSWQGWIIVLLTLGAQFWLLFIFVGGAEIDWRNDQSDLVYTWQCRRDEDECVDTNDLDPGGWIAFSILMIAHLLKDIINGTKLIGLSAKQRHSHHKRARFFVGGTLLTTVSLFTLYVSTIYNNAIATNNREIIENSVIILFICDIDEMLYGIFMVINEDWVHTMSIEENNQDADVETSRQDKVDSLEEESQHETNQTLALADRTGAVSSLNDEVQSLKTVVGALQETVRQQHEQLKRLIPTP